MGAVGGKRSIRWPFEHGDVRIIFFDARDGFVYVIDINAKVMQARYVSVLSSDHCNADITIADAHGIVGTDRFLFLLGTGFRSLHAEYRFIKLCLAYEVLADDREVLNSVEHLAALRSAVFKRFKPLRP